MKYLHYILCSLACSALISPSFAQRRTTQINFALKKSLDSIALEDQRYRFAQNVPDATLDSLAKIYHQPADQIFDYLMAKQTAIDSSNLIYIESVFKKYGYPGKTLVGTPTNEAAFYVIQHSPKIKEYLPLLQKAGKAKELPMPLVAMMEDRSLVEEQKKQIYGTQLWGDPVKDSVTGVIKPVWYFDPIADPANVNKRRREAGFTTTVEEQAKEMGVPYVVKTPKWWTVK